MEDKNENEILPVGGGDLIEHSGSDANGVSEVVSDIDAQPDSEIRQLMEELARNGIDPTAAKIQAAAQARAVAAREQVVSRYSKHRKRPKVFEFLIVFLTALQEFLIILVSALAKALLPFIVFATVLFSEYVSVLVFAKHSLGMQYAEWVASILAITIVSSAVAVEWHVISMDIAGKTQSRELKFARTAGYSLVVITSLIGRVYLYALRPEFENLSPIGLVTQIISTFSGFAELVFAIIAPATFLVVARWVIRHIYTEYVNIGGESYRFFDENDIEPELMLAEKQAIIDYLNTLLIRTKQRKAEKAQEKSLKERSP